MWIIKVTNNLKQLKYSEAASPKKAQQEAKKLILELFEETPSFKKEHIEVLRLLQEDKVIDATSLLEYKTHYRVEIYYD